MDNMIEPAGLRVLSSLIDLFNNKDKISKVIGEIENKIGEANAAIAVVGKISDIDKNSLAAAEDRAEAAQMLSAAKGKAAGIERKAKESAEARLQASNAAVAEVVAREQEVGGREMRVTAREGELQKTMDSAGRKMRRAEKLKEEADVLMAEAARQLAAFREVASTIS